MKAHTETETPKSKSKSTKQEDGPAKQARNKTAARSARGALRVVMDVARSFFKRSPDFFFGGCFRMSLFEAILGYRAVCTHDGNALFVLSIIACCNLAFPLDVGENEK